MSSSTMSNTNAPVVRLEAEKQENDTQHTHTMKKNRSFFKICRKCDVCGVKRYWPRSMLKCNDCPFKCHKKCWAKNCASAATADDERLSSGANDEIHRLHDEQTTLVTVDRNVSFQPEAQYQIVERPSMQVTIYRPRFAFPFDELPELNHNLTEQLEPVSTQIDLYNDTLTHRPYDSIENRLLRFIEFMMSTYDFFAVVYVHRRY